MITVAINVLWFLIGLIILCGIVYLAIYVIEWATSTPLPDKVKKGVWLIVLLLALIALLTAVLGGGAPRFPSLRGELGEPSGVVAAISASAARYLPWLLS